MTLLLSILLIAGAIVFAAIVFVTMTDSEVMPLGCPRCHAGSEQPVGGVSIPWYQAWRGQVRCRHCLTRFREHPNGTLVEDRD
jgi:hypothetical protein